MNKEFDSKPVCGNSDKYIKTKTELYGDKTNTNLQGKKIPKEIGMVYTMFVIDNARSCC